MSNTNENKLIRFKKISGDFNEIYNFKHKSFLDRNSNPMYSNSPEFIKLKIKNYIQKANEPKVMPLKEYLKLPQISYFKKKENFDKFIEHKQYEELKPKKMINDIQENKALNKSNLRSSISYRNSMDMKLTRKESAFSPNKNKIKFNFNDNQEEDQNEVKIVSKETNILALFDSPKRKKSRPKSKKSTKNNFNFEDDWKNHFKFGYFNKNTNEFNENSNRNIKHNKDFVIEKLNLLVINNFHIFGIISGFGNQGEEVGQQVKFSLLQYFNDHNNYCKEEKDRMKYFNNTDSLYSLLKDNGFNQILDSTNVVLRGIKKMSKIDSNTSGAILCCVFIIDKKILCLNIGDLRCMIIETNKSKFINSIHSIVKEDERMRILSNKNALIERNPKTDCDEIFLRYSNKPSIKFTRCVGSTYAYEIGVLNKPDIFEYDLIDDSRAIVIASNIFWSLVSEEEINDTIEKYISDKNAEQASKDLVEYALKLYMNVSIY